MSLRISRRDVEDAYRYADRAISSARDMSLTSGTKGRLIQTGEVLAGAALVGTLSGRFGPLKIKGAPVPLDLVAGVAGHLAAMFDLAGSYGEHVQNVSDGVLAAYVTKFAVGLGTKMREKAGEPPITVSGTDPIPTNGNMPYSRLVGPAQDPGAYQSFASPLTEAELVALSQEKE